MATILPSNVGMRPRTIHATALRLSAMLLDACSSISAFIFGAYIYILAFFSGTAVSGVAQRWNESLPALHDARTQLATIAIGSQFLAGGILLLLGRVQFIGGIRRAFPAVHGWLGRLYVLFATRERTHGLC